MDKIILSLVIAMLSYVCIAQSNLMDSVSMPAEDIQLEEVLVAEELSSTEDIVESEGQVAEEKPKKAGMMARVVSIDQNREARTAMWQGRVDRLLKAMGVSLETDNFLHKSFLGTNTAYVIAGICAFILGILLHKLIVAIEDVFLGRMKKRKSLRALALYLGDFIRPINKFVVLFGLSICVYLNVTNDMLLIIAAKLLALYFFWLGLSLVLSLLNTFFDLLLEKVSPDSPAASMLIPLARNVAITVSVVIFSLIVLENFGLNVGAILASLGIGGAALAFASKDTIANFFGSVSLVIDRPFVVGNEVKVAGLHGFVEKIGLRSTRIRTFDKTLICLPNSILANEYIENLSLRGNRRVEFSVGLVYSTTQEELQLAVKAIEKALKSEEGVVKDPMTVRFNEFADSSLNIYIIFFTEKADWASYIEIKDRANFAIMKAVRDLGLSMAFPSRSLYIENEAINITNK